MGTLCVASDGSPVAVSNKQAKRMLFKLEKMHWDRAALYECEDWLSSDLRFYLSDSKAQFIQLVFDKQTAWCRYEMYLERFSHYVRRRKERDAEAALKDVAGSCR
jgi:hypothetical protein